MERYHFAVQFSRCSAAAYSHDVSFPKPAALGSVLIVVIYSYVSARRGTCRSHVLDAHWRWLRRSSG